MYLFFFVHFSAAVMNFCHWTFSIKVSVWRPCDIHMPSCLFGRVKDMPTESMSCNKIQIDAFVRLPCGQHLGTFLDWPLSPIRWLPSPIWTLWSSSITTIVPIARPWIYEHANKIACGWTQFVWSGFFFRNNTAEVNCIVITKIRLLPYCWILILSSKQQWKQSLDKFKLILAPFTNFDPFFCF